jgi:hypothetical protein
MDWINTKRGFISRRSDSYSNAAQDLEASHESIRGVESFLRS